MTTTRALVTRGGGEPPRVVDVVLDPVGEGEVLVEISASAVCRTELLTIQAPEGSPTVLGHAGTGVVAEVGPGVTRFSPGDAVVIVGTRQCGTCFYCLNGAPGACEEIFAHMTRRLGVTPEGEVVWGDGGLGSHAERLVHRQSSLVRIEGDGPREHLALLGCGITSGVGSVRDVAGVRPGQSVVISGCGHLGLWMVQAARLAGATTIVAVDPEPWRRERALALGATHVLDASGDVVAEVKALTHGRGADVGLEAAGTTLAMRQSFESTRYGGVVVPTGLESLTAEVTLSNLQYSLSSRTIIGSQCGGGDVQRLVPEFERLLAQGSLDAESIITARYPFEGSAAAYPALADPEQLTGVILMPAGAPAAAATATDPTDPTRPTPSEETS
ncbi:zinc-binding dehydrogenase [Herbiconiux sp. P15]|uniref:zinc-binding dehydrogenase n=1 Tax=Herbiconiux liukaitaii TaxID=3342799 RepID=UPI0035B86614